MTLLIERPSESFAKSFFRKCLSCGRSAAWAFVASTFIYWWLGYQSSCLYRESQTRLALDEISWQITVEWSKNTDNVPQTKQNVIDILKTHAAEHGPPNRSRKMVETFTDAWGNELRVCARGPKSLELISSGLNQKFDSTHHDDLSVLATQSEKGIDWKWNDGWPEYKDGESRLNVYWPIRFYVPFPHWPSTEAKR